METSPNRREGIEEILQNFVEHAHERDCVPRLREALNTFHHQELQKAREEAVRKFATDLCRVCTKRYPEYGQALPLHSEDVAAIASRYLDQSELDQPDALTK